MTKYLFLINIIITGDYMKDKYINFLKKYDLYREDIFDYKKDKTKYIDYRQEKSEYFIGVFPNIDNGIIKDIKMTVPYIIDNYSIAINIHEYIHILNLFDYIGKEYVFSNYEDLLPVFYELVFAKENNDINYINERINYLKDNFIYLQVLVDIFDPNNNQKTFKKTNN